MPRHCSLSVIGEHFDHAFIDEDPQGQVFSLFQFKRWFDIPNSQNLTRFARRNREATAAAFAIDDGIAVQDLPFEKLEAKLLEDMQVLRWAGKGGK